MEFLTPDRIRRASGLQPRVWFCVGSGYSREDLKERLLSEAQGFVSDAVAGIEDIALRMIGADKTAVLGPAARQEVLRLLLSVRQSSSRMPELNRLKRQSRFYRRLDQAVQAGRMCFAHEQEAQVLTERLPHNPVRDEISRLAAAYEGWLEASALFDGPLLLASATTFVENQGWPSRVELPDEIVVLSNQAPESRERAFWEALSRHVTVTRVGPTTGDSSPRVEWELWHASDDAADRLADRLLEQGWEQEVILLHDAGEARRSLFRALKERGIPLADPRDPTRIRWDEAIKRATLGLETVAKDFERDRVIAYLQWACAANAAMPEWVEEIQARGIRSGLAAYQGGVLAPVHARLSQLAESLGGKRTCAELGQAHLAGLRAALTGASELSWVIGFFEKLWEAFVRDTSLIGQGDRRAQPLHWLERLQARLEETPSPAPREKSERGVRIYRLHQAPLVEARRVWVMGLPPGWLSGESTGDSWWPERDREALSEFGVRSGIQVREERLASMGAWLSRAEEAIFVESSHDPSGRERESVAPVLREIAESLVPAGVELALPEGPETFGAHPRWLASYGALRPIAPLEARLSPLAGPDGSRPEIPATALDAYSKCGFIALGYNRWKLWDLRQADADPWPDARGNILHEAVRVLVESRTADGAFEVSSGDALEQAWARHRPRGMLKGRRIEAYARARLRTTLEAFCAKEREYFDRARTRPIALDDQKFRYETSELAIVGTPDRVDEHPDGIFVIDYKAKSSLPTGTEMVELGSWLQLPFYALAAGRATGKRVIGVQFVELTRTAARRNGIFFKEWNGKDPGRLTKTTANSKSLFAGAPEDVWSRLETEILAAARGYTEGRFEARPKRREKECRTCRLSDLCGFRRLSPEVAEEGGA